MSDQPRNPYAAPGPDDQGRYAAPPPPPAAGPGDGSGSSPYGSSHQPQGQAYGSPYAQRPADQPDHVGQTYDSYGQPTAEPHGYGYSSHGAPAGPPGQLAGWGSRVGARLLDSLLELLPMLVALTGLVIFILNAPSDGTSTSWDTGEVVVTGPAREGNPTMMAVGGIVALVGYLLTLAVWVWNRVLRQGRTGQSWGKKVMGQHLVDETTGGPVGAGKCFLRELAHYFDGLLLNLGYLWPLWDAKRQTFADKLCTTVVTRDAR